MECWTFAGERLANYANLPYRSDYNYIMAYVMEEAVSAAEANRKFSLLLRGIREGHSYVVTSHGKPIARLVPADKSHAVAMSARMILLGRLEVQPVMNAGRWTRDELYEDDE